MDRPFLIDIWSDVICPFCCIGKAHLSAAIDQFEHRDSVALRLRAFELDPRAKTEYPHSLDELVAAKYSITIEQANRQHRRLESEAAKLGFEWHLDQARPSNTFDAHRLIALASSQNLGRVILDRLFRAYFSDGELLSDHSLLIAIGEEFGVSGTREMLRSDDYGADVRADEADAMELGFSGVPAFLLDQRFVVSGAQPVEVMVDVLERAWARRLVA